MSNKERNIDGKYDYKDFDLICECGHKLGIHSGRGHDKKRGCLNEDIHIPGATGEYCKCENFKKAKKQ